MHSRRLPAGVVHPPGVGGLWVAKVPDLVQRPGDGPHPRGGHAFRGSGGTRRNPGGALSAGVYIFSGGLKNQRASIVGSDGMVTEGPYPEAIGGATIVDVSAHDEALEWAGKIAVACRCPQEVRAFMQDPELAQMLRQVETPRRLPGDV